MKRIEAFENIDRTKGLAESGINRTVFCAYIHAQETGNELLDFDEVVWEKEIDQILENFKTYGINEFTISSTFSGLIPTLAEFEKRGCRMAGLTEVKAGYKDWETGTNKIIPAIRMSL